MNRADLIYIKAVHGFIVSHTDGIARMLVDSEEQLNQMSEKQQESDERQKLQEEVSRLERLHGAMQDAVCACSHFKIFD